MDSKETIINRALAAELDGLRAAVRIDGKRLSVERLASESGVAYGTLRRILNATVDVNVGDLMMILRVINAYRPSPVMPDEVLARAVATAGGLETINAELESEAMSEATGTTDDLEEKRRRKQEEAANASIEEIEGFPSAAVDDDELERPEPDQT